MTNVSTYAVAAVVLTALMWSLYRQAWATVGFLSVALVWTRFTFLPVIPVLAVVLLVWGHKQKATYLLTALKGAALSVALLVVPFVIRSSPGQVWVNLVGYHANLHTEWGGSATWVGFAADLLHERWVYLGEQYDVRYGWLWLMTVPVLGLIFGRITKLKQLSRFTLVTALLLAAGVGSGHLLANTEHYDVPVMPLLALMGGAGWWALSEWLLKFRVRRELTTMLLLAILYWGIFQPQLPLYRGEMDNEASHAAIERVARYVREHSTEKDLVFTPELYVALQANRMSLPGVGVGRWFFWPEFSTEDAAWRGMMNERLFADTVRSRQATHIIFSTTHFWNNVRDNEHRMSLIEIMTEAGYQPVAELMELEPRVETLAVYERID